MSNLLTKFQSSVAAGPPKKVVTLDLGGEPTKVEVRAMTGEVKKAYRQRLKEKKDGNEYHEAALIVSSLFDPQTGEQLFTLDHVPMIQSAPWLFDRVMMTINDLNGWGAEGKDG